MTETPIVNSTSRRKRTMADVFDKDTRSRIMSKIKATETKPEILVRKFLFSQGMRYRKNLKGLPGKPDIVSRKYGSVVFVNGCFWHGHDGCKHFNLPKSRTDFWRKKIENNIKRDKRNSEMLKEMGWRVFVIWECQLKNDQRNILPNLHAEIISR